MDEDDRAKQEEEKKEAASFEDLKDKAAQMFEEKKK